MPQRCHAHQLPEVKDEAAGLAINPDAVLQACRELEYEGLVAGRPGIGTFVTTVAAILGARLAAAACAGSAASTADGSHPATPTTSAPSYPGTTVPSPVTARPASAAPTTSPAPSATPLPGVADCVGAPNRLRVRPANITLACADNGWGVEKMAWTSWTTSAAMGRGTFWEKLCKPSCADSRIGTYPAAVTLSAVKTSSQGPRFSRENQRHPDEPAGPAKLLCTLLRPLRYGRRFLPGGQLPEYPDIRDVLLPPWPAVAQVRELLLHGQHAGDAHGQHPRALECHRLVAEGSWREQPVGPSPQGLAE